MRLSKPEIVYDLEQSLRLLGLDCIEMYWLHRDDRSRPVGEILETLNEQVKAGSIRYFGCSNWQLDRIQEASDYARQHGLKSFAGSQVSWSLAVKNSGSEPDPTLVTMDAKSQQYHQSSQLSAWAYSSQANGLFAKLAGYGPDSLKTGVKRKYLNPVTMRRYELAKEIAELMSVSITAVILAYLTSQPFPVVSIIGCKTMEQLEESMEAGDVVLPPETIREFERITADYE
jgi:aryl-alcohol dehydrogenase-like predicted oxidoreductase